MSLSLCLFSFRPFQITFTLYKLHCNVPNTDAIQMLKLAEPRAGICEDDEKEP